MSKRRSVKGSAPVTAPIEKPARGEHAQLLEASKGTRFLPGNPGGPGRPKGLMALIREHRTNGTWTTEMIIERVVDIALGRAVRNEAGRRRSRTPRISEQLDAQKIFLGYGFGRMPVLDGDTGGPNVIVVELKPGQDY